MADGHVGESNPIYTAPGFINVVYIIKTRNLSWYKKSVYCRDKLSKWTLIELYEYAQYYTIPASELR